MDSKPTVVLLVEDEILLQADLLAPLEEAGFKVLTATRGQEAIKVFEQKAAEINALITDITLSDNTSGWEVARRARVINSHLPVIYTTSYDAETWASNGVPNSVHIVKPFLPIQVLTALAQLLNTADRPQ